MFCSITDKNVTAMIEDGTIGEEVGFGLPVSKLVKDEPVDEDEAALKENLSDLKSA